MIQLVGLCILTMLGQLHGAFAAGVASKPLPERRFPLYVFFVNNTGKEISFPIKHKTLSRKPWTGEKIIHLDPWEHCHESLVNKEADEFILYVNGTKLKLSQIPAQDLNTAVVLLNMDRRTEFVYPIKFNGNTFHFQLRVLGRAFEKFARDKKIIKTKDIAKDATVNYFVGLVTPDTDGARREPSSSGAAKDGAIHRPGSDDYFGDYESLSAHASSPAAQPAPKDVLAHCDAADALAMPAPIGMGRDAADALETITAGVGHVDLGTSEPFGPPLGPTLLATV